MMKLLMVTLLALGFYSCLFSQHKTTMVHTSDIELFWMAYDKIVKTDKLEEQYRIIEEEYMNKGSKGLAAIMDKRAYTAESYIEAINDSPRFWTSIRSNTLKASDYAEDINADILALRKLYPELKAAEVYFTIGALRTGGTAYKGHVLIGSEIAMADSTTVVEDLEPERLRENLRNYFRLNPINDLVLLNVHEYVHTQQGDYGKNLLAMAVFEGVAEFVSVLAANRPSASPAIGFGQKNSEEIKARFTTEMFSPHWNDWLYNDLENDFGVRDLGYYVGYAICEQYYKTAENKQEAIKKMIELDCANDEEVKGFVAESAYFNQRLEDLEVAYVSAQPKVIGLKEFENKSRQVDPSVKMITIEFSSELNPRFRNFKIGSRGEKFLIPIIDVQWSSDYKSLILTVNLEPDHHYQLIVDNEFRDSKGRTIDKYEIDFKTSKKRE